MFRPIRVSLPSTRQFLAWRGTSLSIAPRPVSQRRCITREEVYADPWLLRDPERLKAYKLVYPHWPRPPMRHPWSTDWQYWEFGDRVAKWAKEWPRSYTYHIDTTGMTPLAFLPKQPEPIFMFTAAGEYYWCNMGDLLRFNARFAGHDDFAERLASEMGNVTSMPWGPGHNNDVSDEILEERARLLEEWNEELKK